MACSNPKIKMLPALQINRVLGDGYDIFITALIDSSYFSHAAPIESKI